jgi:hypothetical protein
VPTEDLSDDVYMRTRAPVATEEPVATAEPVATEEEASPR